MLVLCHCSHKVLDINHATYVVLSRPCCSNECFHKALANDKEREARIRRLNPVPLASLEGMLDAA